MKPAFKTLVVAGLLATAGFSAMAQKHGNPDEAMGGRPGMHRMDPAKMEEMHAKRSAELKDKLKITAAQEANWTTFSNAMKPAARADKPKMDRAELAKLSTPERLDKMKAMRTDLEELTQSIADNEATLANLTAEDAATAFASG